MAKLEIMNKLNRGIHMAGFQIKKHSPEILLTAGIIGGVASAVMACKSTLKVDSVVTETKEKIEKIHTAVEEGKTESGEDYTVEDSKKDLSIVYVQTGVKFIKLYGPAIALGTVSTISILAGHNILRKRYAATAAAFTVIDKNFKEYRGRVIERFGKDLDKELRYNIKAKEVEEVTVSEDGSEVVTTKVVEEIDPNTVGDYSRFYDEWCLGFEKGNPEYNIMTLKLKQSYLNEKLQANGSLFLNEVYDELGMSRTPIGSIVGWIYDPSNPEIDSYVSFGDLYDPSNPNKRDFVNGREPAILLEFNCDGPIYEKIGKKKNERSKQNSNSNNRGLY